jgi:AAA ATPase domain
VIAESTRNLLGNLSELENLGAQDLKGIAGPIRAWAALRDSSAEGRFEAFHTSGLTELIGREEELDLLLRRWSKAKTGEGQVVLISGEAGIGKSRLTAALLERLAAKPHTRLRYFCSPQHTNSAFYPIISQTERAAGLAHHDTLQAKLDPRVRPTRRRRCPRRWTVVFSLRSHTRSTISRPVSICDQWAALPETGGNPERNLVSRCPRPNKPKARPHRLANTRRPQGTTRHRPAGSSGAPSVYAYRICPTSPHGSSAQNRTPSPSTRAPKKARY